MSECPPPGTVEDQFQGLEEKAVAPTQHQLQQIASKSSAKSYNAGTAAAAADDDHFATVPPGVGDGSSSVDPFQHFGNNNNNNNPSTNNPVGSPTLLSATRAAGDDNKDGKDKNGKDDKEKKTFKEGTCTPGQEWGIDADYIFNILERKDMDKLSRVGGVEGLYQMLQTHPERGINEGTVVFRKEKYGANVLVRKDPVTFLEFVWEAFKDPMIILLCVCAVVSIIFGMTLPNPHTGEVERSTGWIEGTAIIISIIVVTMTNSISNYQKAKRFEEMEREQAVVQVQVFRDGHEKTIMSDELVVGDIVNIEGGTLLSCDGLYVHGSDLKCNESAMTGEPDIISKSPEKDPFFLSGTQIEEGSGRMMVMAVGMESIQGRLKDATNEEAADTPLQEHLEVLAGQIAKFGFAAAIILIAALYIKEGILISQGKKATAAAFLNYLIIAVAVIVVAIPEGLPLAVTISLAFGMKSMMNDNCLVRVLASCETMGGATAVCSDKTGTLTTNVMSVVQGVVCGEEFIINGYGLKERHGSSTTIIDRNSPTFRHISDDLVKLFCEAIALNSTAREQEIDGRIQWVGNKTEHGLLGFCNLTKNNYKDIRRSVAESEQRQFPFNSKKKSMTTIARTPKGETVLYVKGASEIILGDCDTYMDNNGTVQPMNDAVSKLFLDQINDMANQGNRTIAVASKEYPFTTFPDEEPEFGSLTFLGVLGIQDPIREEVPVAVQQCHSASIVVRMVTGDNLNTAIAIAKKCHIFEENNWDYAMTGQEFREMYNNKKSELMDLIPRLRVLARSSPQDKYILVGILQEMGEVVGVTGDGTNDAPALKLANVGFAMQIGTDIAKGAADMVLLDNNFASVVNAVRWGRAVNDNIRKFLQFQLSINIGGVILTLIVSLASSSSKEPFNAVQLLWLNLIMDTLAALALATERPSNASLHRLPTFKQCKLISRRMYAFISIHALFQVGLILAILFSGQAWLETVQGGDKCDHDWPKDHNNTNSPQYDECEKECKAAGGTLIGRYCQQGDIHSTIIFNTFIWFQVFNIFNARKLFGGLNPLEGAWARSKPLAIIIVIIICFQVFAVEVAGKFLSTTPLTWYYWLVCVGFGACELVLGLVVRLLPLDEPIPKAVQESWDYENQLRERRGVPPLHRTTKVSPDANPRMIVRPGDPALSRRSSMLGRSRSNSLVTPRQHIVTAQ